jgi:hypothetical protein
VNLINLTHLKPLNHRILGLAVAILALGCGRTSHQNNDQTGSDEQPSGSERPSDVMPSTDNAQNDQGDHNQIKSSIIGQPRNPTSDGKVSDPNEGEKIASLKPMKYPAAIVIEGGNGIPDFFNTSGQTPLWRVYICLAPTDSKEQGRVELNLKDLGTPIVQTWTHSDSGELSSIDKLVKVNLNYSYTSRFDRTDGGYVSGLAAIQMNSEQAWESKTPDTDEISSVFLSRKNRRQRGSSPSYLELFDLATSEGTLGERHTYTYKTDSKDFYVAVGLERSSSYRVTGDQHIIAACENADRPVVWQRTTEELNAQVGQ